MFSQTEYLFVRDLTIDFYNDGYKDYLCYTNTESSYNSTYYDVYCYFSKNDIDISGYTISLHEDTKKCLLDTKNSTSNYKNSNSLSCSDNTDSSVSIDSKEFIYSNVGYNSNIIADYETSLNNHLTLNDFGLIVLLLVLPIVVGFVHHFFRID